ncbi:MAG: TIGR01777 family oxidoreductase [Holophagales bacterium]|nr:TIGR01777 family oxidoreductase [Holophagales bacterium]
MPEESPSRSETRTIAVSGSTGLVGAAFAELLHGRGDRIVPLVRPGSPSGGGIPWDPAAGELDADRLAEVDGVVHLAGESIAGGRWTAAKKRRIRNSRVDGTRLLAEGLASLPEPPPLICASAIGFYGDRGDERLDEDSPPGKGFLAEVCRDWEAAADPAREAGVRVTHLRFGVVLSASGGALAQMLTPFRLGLGGRIGDGRQWMSWIHLRDAARALELALDDRSLEGPVNAVAPEPVRNLRFTRGLGRAVGRPTFLPLPSLAVRVALGEMGRELLLASSRVEPARLAGSGFEYRHAELDEALAVEVGS